MKPASRERWYAMTAEDALAHFGTNADVGLSPDKAASLLETYGENSLGLASGPTALQVLMANLFNPMNFVLLIAIVFAGVVKDIVQVGVLGGIMLINTCIGFLQEYRSEKTMAALRSLASPTARLVRDGQLQTVPSVQVVPGDILYLEEGDQVPADVRLIEAVNLQADEMLLSGESLPVTKTSGLLNCTRYADSAGEDDISLGDRKNLAFSSTIVTRGRGRGVVFATGLATEVGKIANLLTGESTSSVEDTARAKAKKKFLTTIGWGVKGDGKTPLQHSMDRMMLVLLGFAILLAVVVFGAQRFVFNHETALYAISVAIAIVPEGLPAVLTVTFAIGVRTMAKHKVLVRKIASVEALGMVTNICSDKTGTLTEGRMSVKAMWIGGKSYLIDGTGLNPALGKVTCEGQDLKKEQVDASPSLAEFAAAVALCNNATVHAPNQERSEWHAIGDPTEIALQVLAHRLSFPGKAEAAQRDLKFVHEYPFDSALKRMSIVYSTHLNVHGEATSRTGGKNGKYLLKWYMKGAFERTLECCEGYYDMNGKVVSPVSSDFYKEIEDNMRRLAAQGLRVLAVAHRQSYSNTLDVPHEREQVEKGFIFLGLCGMYDPPRESSAPSVSICRQAGIVVHMATGDHIETARAIAKQIGILTAGQEDLVVPASRFDNMADEDIDGMEELPLVLARCSPETKVKFIRALHRRGKFVAMTDSETQDLSYGFTGDGTNDAPAIKMADIGIAMGMNGSDVAKEASAIVLTDDNFASIVKAVSEGRRIFANMVKLALSFLSTNVAEIVALIFALAIRNADGEAIFPM
ncbi:hypothetical protein HDU86_005982 [Geranomyces michiganensis]|nr:hypothetical protein HDU86_005982 [Geranomyces michiganensis]